MKNSFLLILLSAVLFSCKDKTITVTNKPELLLNLPDSCNTPDGLVQGPDGTILLSMPNHNDPSYKSHIYKIVGNTIQLFTDLPVEPTTNHVCPMDLAYGPDGNVSSTTISTNCMIKIINPAC